MKNFLILLTLLLIVLAGCSSKGPADLKWTFQETNTTENINSISFIDGKRGWAVTSGGNLLVTTDGGQSWNMQNVTDRALTTVYAIDKKNIWLAGMDGALYSSMEESQSFNDKSMDDDVDFVQIAFWNDDNGVLVGNRSDKDGNVFGSIYRTEDGGQEWTEIYMDIDSITSLWILGDDLGWVSTTGHIWNTSNHGESWEDNYLGSDISINSMYYDDFNSGYLVGDSGTYYTSFDGGWSWDSRGGEFPGVNLYDICFIDRFVGMICGANGTLMISGTGGDSWQSNSALSQFDFYDVEVRDNQFWVCGANGQILHVH